MEIYSDHVIATIHADTVAERHAAGICHDHATVPVDIKTNSFQLGKRFYRTHLIHALLVHVQARVYHIIKICDSHS